jgi:hypothetical protein
MFISSPAFRKEFGAAYYENTNTITLNTTDVNQKTDSFDTTMDR